MLQTGIMLVTGAVLTGQGWASEHGGSAEPQGAKASAPISNGLADWPDSPARRVSRSRYRVSSGGGGGGGGASASPVMMEASPPVSIGISTEIFRATVAAGKKVFLPAPQGECNLTGSGVTASLKALDSCLAARAAK